MVWSVRLLTAIVVIATGSLMILAYIGMLYHIEYRGNKNKWLKMLVIMLLLSQIGVFLFGVSFLLIFVCGY